MDGVFFPHSRDLELVGELERQLGSIRGMAVTEDLVDRANREALVLNPKWAATLEAKPLKSAGFKVLDRVRAGNRRDDERSNLEAELKYRYKNRQRGSSTPASSFQLMGKDRGNQAGKVKVQVEQLAQEKKPKSRPVRKHIIVGVSSAVLTLLGLGLLTGGAVHGYQRIIPQITTFFGKGV